MGTLAVSFTIFCLCVGATPDDRAKTHLLVAWTGVLSLIVFTARVLGFVVEWGGW